MTKLSIITVNLNNAEGLRKTIESVKCQTFTNYEHIIIDGGSTDGSVELIQQYETTYQGVGGQLYWVSEKDRGIYNAMNKGIRVAKGVFIYFLNSGDIFVSKETLKQIFSQNINSSLAIGSILIKNLTIKYPNKISFQKIYLETICHQAILYKKSLFEKYGFYDERYKIVADYKHLLNLLIKENIEYSVFDVLICKYDNTGLSSNPTSALLLSEERKNAQVDVLSESICEFADEFFEQQAVLNGLYSSGTVKLALKISTILKYIKSIF